MDDPDETPMSTHLFHVFAQILLVRGVLDDRHDKGVQVAHGFLSAFGGFVEEGGRDACELIVRWKDFELSSKLTLSLSCL
jgi:hypothetical protein